jgi:hypothetical protein
MRLLAALRIRSAVEPLIEKRGSTITTSAAGIERNYPRSLGLTEADDRACCGWNRALLRDWLH